MDRRAARPPDGAVVTRLSPRVAMGLGLAAVGGVTALVVVLAIGLGGGGGRSPVVVGGNEIQATTALTPQAALFGDTVTAKVDVTFDRTEYSPDDVNVLASFAPWVKIGTPSVAWESAGSLAYLRTTYVLRCIDIRCVPTNGSTRYQFRPARVVYQRPAGSTTERLTIDAPWPTLVLHTRLDSSTSPTERDTLAAPWRADYISLPAVTYRASPGFLIALLVLAGAALVAVGGVLAYRARPRRAPPPPPPPPPPAPRLAPLEQALALLETPHVDGQDGVAERRRALELVADEVATWGGDPSVERNARRLAWSEEDPAVHEMKELAANVRTHAAETDAKEAEERAREADAQPV